MGLLRSYSFNSNSNCATHQTGSEDCSDDFSVGLIHLPAGSEMPQHGEEARVLGRRANYNSFEIDFAKLSFLFHDLIRFSLAKIEKNHLSFHYQRWLCPQASLSKIPYFCTAASGQWKWDWSQHRGDARQNVCRGERGRANLLAGRA